MNRRELLAVMTSPWSIWAPRREQHLRVGFSESFNQNAIFRLEVLLIPDEVSHGEATAEIPETLVRVSVGLEDPDDLCEDLRTALP